MIDMFSKTGLRIVEPGSSGERRQASYSMFSERHVQTQAEETLAGKIKERIAVSLGLILQTKI